MFELWPGMNGICCYEVVVELGAVVLCFFYIFFGIRHVVCVRSDALSLAAFIIFVGYLFLSKTIAHYFALFLKIMF